MAALEGTATLSISAVADTLQSGDITHTRSIWRRIDEGLLHYRVILPRSIGVSEVLHTRTILGRTTAFDLLHVRQILRPEVAGLWDDDIQRPIGRANLT